MSEQQVKGFIRHRKIKGTHRMYCPVREKKVVLGQGRDDGDVAYLTPAGVPAGSNESWKRIDSDEYVAEASEQEMQKKAGEPEGTLEVFKRGQGSYDVINTATNAPINTSPLTEEEANALVNGSPEEKKGLLTRMKDKVLGKDTPPADGEGDDLIVCPKGYKYGTDNDEHEDCDDCPLAEGCQAAKGAIE